MPLARRFTLRLGRQEPTSPLRSPSVRKEISLPLNLLSTTNTLSYDAPTLEEARKQMASPAASSSPSTPGSFSNPSSPEPMAESPTLPSLTDSSSLESSPVLEYNHLSAYFPANLKPAIGSGQGMLSFEAQAPAIPKRVPSHSKKEHERLARKRSLRAFNPALRSPKELPSPADSTHFAIDQVIEDAEGEHVDEVAYMHERGLCKLSASDYQTEIGLAFWTIPETPDVASPRGWI